MLEVASTSPSYPDEMVRRRDKLKLVIDWCAWGGTVRVGERNVARARNQFLHVIVCITFRADAYFFFFFLEI